MSASAGPEAARPAHASGTLEEPEVRAMFDRIARVYDVDYELAGVGRKMYTRWLADYCLVEPERHVGLAQLPMWDIDAAVKRTRACRSQRRRGIEPVGVELHRCDP